MNPVPIFQTELGKLYCGDMEEILPQLNVRADLVVTDPPYVSNVGNISSGFPGREKKAKALAEIGSSERYLASLATAIDTIFAHLFRFASVYIYTSVKGLPLIFDRAKRKKFFYNLIVWVKSDAVPMMANNFCPDLEYLVYLHRGKWATWNTNCAPEFYHKYFVTPTMKRKREDDHPTEKPMRGILPYILLSSIPDQLVLDPFSGSGTTCVAAEMTGRRWIGIERQKKYCYQSIERIQKATAMPLYEQKKLFKEVS